MLIPDMATGQVSIDLGAKGQMVLQLQHVQLVQTQLVKHLKSYNVAMHAMITGGTEAPITWHLDSVLVVPYLQMMIKNNSLSSIPRRSRWLRYG